MTIVCAPRRRRDGAFVPASAGHAAELRNLKPD